MVDRFYGYQYDTNPRKLTQQQTPYRNRYSQKSSSEIDKNYSVDENKKSNTSEEVYKRMLQKQRKQQEENEKLQKTIKNNKNKAKNSVKPKLKLVMLLLAGFSVLFAISYQNSLISESFNKKEQYKKEMEALSKTNQQIEVGIENSLNLNNIEQAAKEKIGMQKLNNNQKIYVSLPKEDYVAPATEQVIIEEEMGFFEKLLKGFTNSIN